MSGKPGEITMVGLLDGLWILCGLRRSGGVGVAKVLQNPTIF